MREKEEIHCDPQPPSAPCNHGCVHHFSGREARAIDNDKEESCPGMDSFDQAGLSPSTFFNGLGLSPQPVLQPGPRKYKSRKERPCDFCRRRQVSCKIDVAPPCQLCQNHGRECTFVERPKKKRRPNNSVGDGKNVTNLGGFSFDSCIHSAGGSVSSARNSKNNFILYASC